MTYSRDTYITKYINDNLSIYFQHAFLARPSAHFSAKLFWVSLGGLSMRRKTSTSTSRSRSVLVPIFVIVFAQQITNLIHRHTDVRTYIHTLLIFTAAVEPEKDQARPQPVCLLDVDFLPPFFVGRPSTVLGSVSASYCALCLPACSQVDSQPLCTSLRKL